VEKWARYWKGLLVDYKDAVKDTVLESRQKPGKAITYAAALGLIGAAIKRNPPEQAYRSRVIEARDEVNNFL